MIRRLMFICFGLLVTTPVRASHYDLTSIDLMETSQVEALAQLGIATTEDLWKATRTPRQESRLARALKVSKRTIRDWADFCDVLRIEGIGPKVVRVLRLSGIRRVRDLARQDPERLTSRIAEVNKEHEILGKLPDVATVRHWVESAAKLSATQSRSRGR